MVGVESISPVYLQREGFSLGVPAHGSTEGSSSAIYFVPVVWMGNHHQATFGASRFLVCFDMY